MVHNLLQFYFIFSYRVAVNTHKFSTATRYYVALNLKKQKKQWYSNVSSQCSFFLLLLPLTNKFRFRIFSTYRLLYIIYFAFNQAGHILCVHIQ